jgi:DNA-binding transcriptional ArsR family regulator
VTDSSAPEGGVPEDGALEGRGGAPGELVLRSPAHFRALGHPLRHRLFNLLRQRPATLAQLAAALGSTKGTVGYHVQLMLDAGVIRLAGTRRVRGGTERYYEPVGTDLRHDTDAADRTAFLVDAARGEMLPHRPGDEDFAVLRHLRLTPAQARDLAARLAEFSPPQPGPAAPGPAAPGPAAPGPAAPAGDAHGLLLCLYRADIPDLPPETVPPETVPPETVPPETVPPETVPPETVPPETVPPVTVPPVTVPPEIAAP